MDKVYRTWMKRLQLFLANPAPAIPRRAAPPGLARHS